MSSIEMTGKTTEEAVEKALQELQLTKDQVEIEVLAEGKDGFFGMFGRKAKVRVTAKTDTEAASATVAIKTAEPAVTAVPAEDDKPASAPAEAAAPGEKRAAEPKEFVVDEQAVEMAKKFLKKIFTAMKITVAMEKFVNKNTGSVILKLHGDDMGILIGKHGQTLDALQYLTNLVANKNATCRMHVVIDVENYRDRRVETLTKLAKRLADKVKKSGERVVLEPMNPHERKIIHTALQADRSVTTLSEGSDPYRRVVIELKK